MSIIKQATLKLLDRLFKFLFLSVGKKQPLGSERFNYHLFKLCVRMLPKNNIKLYYHDSWRPLTHNSTDEMELSVTVIRLIGCKWNIYIEFCERDTVGEYM